MFIANFNHAVFWEDSLYSISRIAIRVAPLTVVILLIRVLRRFKDVPWILIVIATIAPIITVFESFIIYAGRHL